MKVCWILSKTFSTCIEIIMGFLSDSINVLITFIDLCMLKHHSICKMKPTWSWFFNVLFNVVNMLFNSVHSVFDYFYINVHQLNWTVVLFFLVSLSSFAIRVILAYKWVWKHSSLYILWNSLNIIGVSYSLKVS
jgi:hypothetical protein